ncbi:MAG: hypothetical protein ACE5GF_03130 [Thermodesulfobacteriota bacterium]
MTMEAAVTDAVDDLEAGFPHKELFDIEYFQKYRHGYYSQREQGYPIPPRNYLNLLRFLSEIQAYNAEHGNSFAKSLRTAGSDWRNCEAAFAEIIVYRYYIRLVYEGLVKSLDRDHQECDVIVERLDGSKAYLEVFCVMPNLKEPKAGEVVVQDIKTHTQTEMASIRQKLLRKIEKQKQLAKPRDNFAVIELNDFSIAGDFAILSSLSSGYKIRIDKKTMKATASGYDWQDSIFEDESTRFLKGIIYFDLGAYESRKFIINPAFQV